MNKLLELEIEKLKKKLEDGPKQSSIVEIKDLENSNILDELNHSSPLKILKRSRDDGHNLFQQKRNNSKLEKRKLFRSFRASSKGDKDDSASSIDSNRISNIKSKGKFRGFSKFKEQRDRNKSAKLMKQASLDRDSEEPNKNHPVKHEIDFLIEKARKSPKTKKPDTKVIKNNYMNQVEKKEESLIKISAIETPFTSQIYKKNEVIINEDDNSSSACSNYKFSENLNQSKRTMPLLEINEDYLNMLVKNESSNINFISDISSIGKPSVNMDYSRSVINSKLSSLQEKKPVIESKLIRPINV